jgi:hypothetical protein
MARQGSVFSRFRQFDAYAKTLDDFRVKTTTGASGKIISAFVDLVIDLYCLYSDHHQHNLDWLPHLFRIAGLLNTNLAT